MEKSINLLNSFRSQCHSEILYYQDNRSVAFNHSYKYICGRIDGSIWLNRLIDKFLKYEIIIFLDLTNNIISKKLTLLDMSSDYNQGLYDQLDEMEKRIDDRINCI